MNANTETCARTHTHSLLKIYKEKSGKPNFACRLKGTTPDLGQKTQNALQQSSTGCSPASADRQFQLLSSITVSAPDSRAEGMKTVRN